MRSGLPEARSGDGLLAGAGLLTSDAVAAGTVPAEERQRRRRRQIWIVQTLIVASYGVDALGLSLFVLLGLVSAQTLAVYAASFALLCALAAIGLKLDLDRRLKDPHLLLPQFVAATLIQFALIVNAPQIGIPALTVLFVIVGFAGLRLSLTQAVFASGWIALGVCGVIFFVGDQLQLPMDSPAERIISGLWVSSVVIRVIMLGQYGVQLRRTLVRRNEELSRTMLIAERLASRDGLTGILNRGSILKAIEAERARMLRTGQPFSVALLDIDNFKQVNDNFGHLVGDQVLIAFVGRVDREMRGTDELGRYGGEEFLMLINGVGGPVSARWAIERILRSIEEHDWSLIAKGLQVTTSAGLATCGRDESITQLLARADGALYRAKNEGRNRICVG